MFEGWIKALQPLKRRIAMMVARGVLQVSDDEAVLQAVQLEMLADEVATYERVQNYGMTSHVPAGGEAVVVCPGGNREHGLVVAVDDRRYRLKGLAEGEVAIYTDEGDSLHLQRGNRIAVTTGTLVVNAADAIKARAPVVTIDASDAVLVNTPVMKVSGAIQAGGDIVDKAGGGGQSMAGMRRVYNSHTHTEQGQYDGDTSSVPNQSMV